ncbi:M56 family metallopeptidase [Flavobacterium antarcticum]|uniref:M56 family metallopeptidase n=1 Tax=Flavobacterium antarcticum TaxID=271155 RepID=UPI0003B78E99|nr:M56 family metallopeptidase [Flavobacterium antarcticum]
MENLVIYLIKSSTLLLFFFTTYYFLLKKETFFTANRWFLIVGIFCSALLPLLTFQKIVWVEPVVSTVQLINTGTTSNTITNVATLEENAFSWELVLIVLYGLGVLIFLSKLIIEFYSLKKVISTNNKRQSDGFEFIEVNHLITPFSFFKKIVYNPNLFQAEELENIIEHEKIHAKQLHSVDVLIARMNCILFWWNPLVWLYKKAMVQNLEFIADQNALAKAVDKKSYLLTLLKITTAENPVAITNHFYQSLIKKRIVMLHKNQSKKHHSWKYLLVIPALVFFMLTYQIEVVAQEKKSTETIIEKTTTKAQMTVSSSSTDEVIYKEADYFKKEFGILMKFKKISRNKKGEITSLSVTLSDKKGNTKVYDVSESEAIKPFTIFVNTDENGQQTFGFGGTKENQHLKQHFEAVEKNQKNTEKESQTFNEYPELPTLPTHPVPPNYPTPPSMLKFPTPPVAPTVPNTGNNKKVWNKFNNEMKIFKKEMDSEAIRLFDEETKQYILEISALKPESKEFLEKMKEFNVAMTKFNKLVKAVPENSN